MKTSFRWLNVQVFFSNWMTLKVGWRRRAGRQNRHQHCLVPGIRPWTRFILTSITLSRKKYAFLIAEHLIFDLFLLPFSLSTTPALPKHLLVRISPSLTLFISIDSYPIMFMLGYWRHNAHQCGPFLYPLLHPSGQQPGEAVASQGMLTWNF